MHYWHKRLPELKVNGLGIGASAVRIASAGRNAGDDGLCWRLGFVDESAAAGLNGRVRVRGRIVEVDRFEGEYVEVQNDA